MSPKEQNKTPRDHEAPGVRPEPQEEKVETRHRVAINGQEIKYTATAGTMLLRKEIEEGETEKDGHQPKASMFYIAYTRDDGTSTDGTSSDGTSSDGTSSDVPDPSQRPITFSFNGGPGSSSVWLHLGLLGPRRVWMEEMGNPPPPPYRLVDNDLSLLDHTDLVFIDPVSTGYSRAVPGEKPGQFHSIEADIAWVGEFIRLFTTRMQRWASPKFLIGESYGTTRAAGLAGHLQERHGLFLNGVMLVSSILNFQTADFNTGNDLPHILFLPTYTATAWYHNRLAPDLQEDLAKTLAAVEAFALGDYTLALMQGDALPEDTRTQIVAQLARFTGLSEAYIERTNLRIEIMRFTKELLRDQRQTVGRLDSRFTGVDRDAAGEVHDHDPSLTMIMGPYTATFNDYVRRELQFESELPYEILSGRVYPWSYEKYQNQYVNVGETLREAMTKNPELRVHVANGYYDLATPYFATQYTFNHLGLEPELREHISMSYYPAGHMMYVHQPSLAQLREALGEFIRSSYNAP